MMAVSGLAMAPSAMAKNGDGSSSGHGSSGSDGLLGTLLGGDPETLDTDWGDDETGEGDEAAELTGTWEAKKDLGSLYSLTDRVGAQHAWHDRVTGAGVTVAVIDTGVTPVPGLDQGQVVNGPDLSYESQRSGTRYLDGFGHGTHMAGIIAGRDPGFRPDKPDDDVFAGVAPGAQILNMKVATGDGGADVSQVIAAIDWVVQHRNDNGMNVRVISLAYGTTSTQPASVDPLAHAVENAWRSGIVVVAAAGNDGISSPSLLMPAADPYVIAVGSVDHLGTKSLNDDTVADFSNGGSASRRPDLVAPGKSVVSLRVPGSYIDDMHPEGLIEDELAHRYFRGSGTSQSTAVVAGAVALLLDDRPYLTPDQVKALLRSSADKLKVSQPAMGTGVLDVEGALHTSVLSTLLSRQTWPASTGLGSLEAARGGEHVFDPSTGTELSGETDALGNTWQPVEWAQASTAGRAWTGGTWGGRAWTGSSWSTAGWSAIDWTGTSWSGVAWEDHTWSEAYWQARSWRDDSWLARSWRYGTWEARSWRAASWEARSWRTESFLARSWRSTP